MMRESAAPKPYSSTIIDNAASRFRSLAFNTYGPRMHWADGRVVSNFIIQALSGEPITLYGNGGQTRSFCYVDDLIDGLVRLMDSELHSPDQSIWEMKENSPSASLRSWVR